MYIHIIHHLVWTYLIKSRNKTESEKSVTDSNELTKKKPLKKSRQHASRKERIGPSK